MMGHPISSLMGLMTVGVTRSGLTSILLDGARVLRGYFSAGESLPWEIPCHPSISAKPHPHLLAKSPK